MREISEDEHRAKLEEFKAEVLRLANEFAPYIGPQKHDDCEVGEQIDNEETIATDVLMVINWQDMASGGSFLDLYPITRTNPSMMVGMLYRTANFID